MMNGPKAGNRQKAMQEGSQVGKETGESPLADNESKSFFHKKYRRRLRCSYRNWIAPVEEHRTPRCPPNLLPSTQANLHRSASENLKFPGLQGENWPAPAPGPMMTDQIPQPRQSQKQGHTHTQSETD